MCMDNHVPMIKGVSVIVLIEHVHLQVLIFKE